MSIFISNRISVFVLTAMLLAIGGCARSERAVLDQAQSLIDQRKYSEAVNLLEKEIPNHDSKAMKTKLGFAYLGKSGLELLEVANKITIFKSFNDMDFQTSDLQTTDLQTVCHDNPVKNLDMPFVCLPILTLENFPDPEQPDLVKALEIFNQINPDPETTDQDINLLLAIINIGSSIKSYDHLVTVPVEYMEANVTFNRELRIKAATHSLKYLKRSVDSFFLGFRRLMFSYDKIRRFFDKYKNQPILTLGTHTYYATDKFSGQDFLDFLVNSAKSDLENESSSASDQQNKNLASYSSSIRRALYSLRLKLTIKDGTISSAVSRLIYAGSDWLPTQMRGNLNRDSVLGLLDPAHYPRVLQRTLEAGKAAWNQENARYIFEAIEDLNHQENNLEGISDQWDYFWRKLDDNGRAELKADLERYRNRIPLVEISESTRINSDELQSWYSTATDTLDDFATRASVNYPDEPLLRNLPFLISNSREWVRQNLW